LPVGPGAIPPKQVQVGTIHAAPPSLDGALLR
jgi:hypothetical protein